MNQKNMPTGKIGSIMLFFVVAFYYFLYKDVDYINNGILLFLLGIITIGIGVLINNNIISIIGSAISLLMELVSLINHYSLLVQGSLAGCAFLIAFVVLIVVLLLPANEVNKIWFLPGTIFAIGSFLSIYVIYYYGFAGSFKHYFVHILFAIAMFFVGHGICNQVVNSTVSAGGKAMTPMASVASATPASQTGNVMLAGNFTTTEPIVPTVSIDPEKADDSQSISIENMKMLRKYKELLDEGILTQEEFDDIKKNYLG